MNLPNTSIKGQNHKKSRNLTVINLIIVAYFILLWLINFYEIDFVLIGVFRELLTIPFLFGQLVLLVLSSIQLLKNQNNRFLILSTFLLAACAVITIGSFL